MVCDRVDHLEQTVNLSTKGNPKSHDKINTRLYIEDHWAAFRTYRKHKQHHSANSTSRAETTLVHHTNITTFSHHPARHHTNRSRRSRAREARWHQSHASKSIKDKYRAFHKGYAMFRKQILPTHQALSRAAYLPHDDNTDDIHYYDPHSDITPRHQVNLARTQESQEMKRMLEFLEDGGIGFMPDKKESGWIRIMFENWNSLGVFTHKGKIDRLNYLIRRLHIDVVAGCECQCNWSMMDQAHQFTSLLVPGIAKKGIAANNTHEKIQRDQKGGTAIAGIVEFAMSSVRLALILRDWDDGRGSNLARPHTPHE